MSEQFPDSPYARVRARVASIWADGPDDGSHPDWRPATGETVTLTPSIGNQLLTYDVTGDSPIIVTVERVQCTVDEEGWLTKNDGRPVYIAPTDDPLLSATGWTWTASIKGKTVPFSAPSGGVVDLAMFIAAPATDNTKLWVARIPELIDAAGSLVSIESVTRDGDDMVVTLTNGSITRVPLPEGREGDPGPAPEINWIGTSLVVDDRPPVDLKGAQGDPPETSWAGTSLVVDGHPPVDLKGAEGDKGDPPETSWIGTSLVVDDHPPVDLKGDKGDPGDPGQYAGVHTYYSSHTLDAADAGRLVTVNSATAATITVPSGLFSVGQRFDVLDIGAGRVTFVEGPGMTLHGDPSLVSRDQYSAHTVVFLSPDVAVVVGDLA